MSGEAGAAIQSDYYHIQFSSGVMVSVAEPPWIEGEERDHDYTAAYFESENKRYINKLNEVKPELDALFNQVVATQELPILKHNSESFFFFGVVLEDTKEIEVNAEDNEQIESWLNDQTEPEMDLNLTFYTDRMESINLSITVNQRVLRSKTNAIQGKIQNLFITN